MQIFFFDIISIKKYGTYRTSSWTFSVESESFNFIIRKLGTTFHGFRMSSAYLFHNAILRQKGRGMILAKNLQYVWGHRFTQFPPDICILVTSSIKWRNFAATYCTLWKLKLNVPMGRLIWLDFIYLFVLAVI